MLAPGIDPDRIVATLERYHARLAGSEHTVSVQGTLVHTDWARRYSTRAVSVIAMFDPTYASDPYEAEVRVRSEVHPLHTRHRRAATLRTASVHHKKSSARRTHKS